MHCPKQTPRLVSILGLTAVLVLLLHVDATAQTALTLVFHGPVREPVPITRAQLLVAAWGVSLQYDLEVEGNVLKIDLEATRPEFAGKIADTSGFVYVKAAGYAPLMSEAFTWPAQNAPTVIDFRNGRRLTIAQGTEATLDVVLRRPAPRRVRLIDIDGRAVAGVKVEAAAHWNTPNHCGFLNGRDVVVAEVTNATGAIDVPDVDGPYAFSLLDSRMVLADADNSVRAGSPRYGLITSLNTAETILRVRRYERRPLAIDIVRDRKPVPKAVLMADMGLGVCGAGYGPLGTADARGRIRIDAFYSEMWTNYWVCAEQKQVWILPPDGQLPALIDVGVTPSVEANLPVDRCRR